MSLAQFQPDDKVYHPRSGFGVVRAVQKFDLMGESAAYYEIGLVASGILWVPVARAEENGLRPLVNSLVAIMAELHAEVRPLPENGRQRMSELNARWLASEPSVLVQTVRDLAGCGRAHPLTASERKWLARAVERLSVEVSLLDAADVATAAAQIWSGLGVSA